MQTRRPSAFHRAFYAVGRALLVPYVKLKYGFRTNRIPPLDEPFLLVSNHTTEEDMFFAGVASRSHMYFVCGEHLLRDPRYGKALRALVDPIPVPKGGASLGAVREILRRLKAGSNVCLFPEGKRSYHGQTIPSPIALGKLVKRAGCALVTYRIEGGYFTHPRWAGANTRKGHVEGHVVGVYGSVELACLSAQEVCDLVNRDTYENAYETQRQRRWPYRGQRLAEGLELVAFICPCCGAWDTVQTSGDAFACTACGMAGTYDEYGFLQGEGLPFHDVLAWMRWIEPEFDGFVLQRAPGELLFAEPDVVLYQMLDGYRNVDLASGTLDIYRDRMVFHATSGGEWASRTYAFADIKALSVLYGNVVLFTCDGTYFGLRGEGFRAWKCARLYHLAKGDTHDATKEI